MVSWDLGELDENLSKMSEIKPFVGHIQLDTPLLHRDGTEEQVKRATVIVTANLVRDIGVKLEWVAFQLEFDQAGFGDLVLSATQGK